MPSVSTNLSKSQREDLIAICKLGAPKLNEITSRLEQQNPTVRRSEFLKVISDVFDNPTASAAASRALPGLATAIRTFNISPTRLFEMIGSPLQEAEDSAAQLWHECGPIIQKIVSLEFVNLYAKARDLAFDFDRLFARARILTDIRPVFDDARNIIVGADVTQTLRLDFFSSDTLSNSLSVAMDTSDIEQLKKACEDALRKAKAAKELIEDNTDLVAVLPGEAGQ